MRDSSWKIPPNGNSCRGEFCDVTDGKINLTSSQLCSEIKIVDFLQINAVFEFWVSSLSLGYKKYFCDSNLASYEQGVSCQEWKVSEKQRKNLSLIKFCSNCERRASTFCMALWKRETRLSILWYDYNENLTFAALLKCFLVAK